MHQTRKQSCFYKNVVFSFPCFVFMATYHTKPYKTKREITLMGKVNTGCKVTITDIIMLEIFCSKAYNIDIHLISVLITIRFHDK